MGATIFDSLDAFGTSQYVLAFEFTDTILKIKQHAANLVKCEINEKWGYVHYLSLYCSLREQVKNKYIEAEINGRSNQRVC
jgi:Mor family transcriptional regulator